MVPLGTGVMVGGQTLIPFERRSVRGPSGTFHKQLGCARQVDPMCRQLRCERQQSAYRATRFTSSSIARDKPLHLSPVVNYGSRLAQEQVADQSACRRADEQVLVPPCRRTHFTSGSGARDETIPQAVRVRQTYPRV